MKISIVTPAYNYGRFLQKNIDSVLAQVGDTVEVEHLIVDACSTDGTVGLLKTWEKKVAGLPEATRARYTFRWTSEPDKGQTDAINKGLSRATGDLVCWLNADEYYEPEALRAVVEAFEKHPEADFIHGEVRFINDKGETLRIKREHVFSRYVLLWYGCYIPSCGSFWRRNILADGFYLDPSYKVTMDFEYFVRLMKLGYRFRFLPRAIAAFTWHSDNVSSVFTERRIAEANRVKNLYGMRVSGNPKVQAAFRRMNRFLATLLRRVLVTLRVLFLPR